MRIAIRDTTDSHTVGFFDNKAGIKFKSAEMTQFLKGACSYVSIKYRSKDAEKVRAGCKLAFRHKGKDYWLTINEFNKQGTEVEITAYSLSLEANKEKRGAYKASRAMSIVDYFSVFDPEKSFEIGINEVSDKKLTLEWTGTDTVLARLYSLANYFDAELEFVTELNPNYSLKRHVVNIYRSGNLGGDSTGRPVRVGAELKVLGFNSNINDLYTAIDVTGKDGLKLPDKTIKDAKGEVQFFSKNGRLYAPQARDKFPSNKVNVNDGYILAEAKTTDYTNQEALFGYALSEMKKHCDVQVEYSTEGAVKGSVGDTKTLIDSINFEPALYVQARITEQTEDLETGKSLKTTFSNFKRTSSQLSNDLTKKIEELAKSAVPHRIVMVTSNGTSFKNGTGQSIVSPKLFKGDAEITDATYRFNFNNNTVAGLNYTVNASSVNGTSVLKIDAYVGNDVVASDELTFINVNDGLNGSKGADGNGIASTAITYQAGTSATVAPTGAWSSSPVSVPAGQFLWTRTIFTYTDTTTKTIYNVSRQGADGISGKDGNGIASTTVSYGTSTSSTTQPSAWTSTIPTVPAGQYLWTRTITDYTDASVPDTISYTYAKQGVDGAKGDQGDAGTSVKVSKIEYQAGTSATTAPTGTWSTTIVSAPAGQYLWSKTTMSDNSIIYGIARQGADGANGKDGQIPHIAYADKSTDVLVDAMQTLGNPWFYSGATGTVSPISGGYKYTTAGGTVQMKQVITFNGTTGKNVYTYLVVKNTHATNDLAIAFNGIGTILNGGFATVIVKPGQTYVDYRPAVCRDTYDFVQINILATVIANDLSYEIYDYAIYNTNPFINFSFASNGLNSHIGMYQDTNTVGSTDPSKYAWTLIKGQKGDQGLPGAPGADGKTPYWHVAYANNATGTLDFSLSDSSGRKFRGEYVDYVLADSTDPTKYKWLDMTANVKVGGVNLLKGTSSEWKDVSVSQYAGFIKTLTPTDLPNLKVGDFLTFSFDVNTSSNKKLRARLSFSGANRHYFSDDYVVSGTGRVSVSGQVPSGWTDLILYVDANLTATTITTITTEQYKRAKLELGNVATDHSEAPEDTQLKIDSKADQALTQEQLNALSEQASIAKAELQAKASIDTLNQWITSYQNYVTSNNADSQQAKADLIAWSQKVEALGTQMGEVKETKIFMDTYFSQSSEGLVIGQTDGTSNILIKEDRISMFSAGNEVMYISQGVLNINNGIFALSIQLGRFREEQYVGNKDINVIRYVGGV
ncbi:phage tail protein [Streptococcus uberis]|uniref:phage tail protein n=1 Tax=Streptococcus uberis TaxID=1349 RepID=UPI002ECB9565|nr:phage tail protein [Streptococcus uberis]